MLQAQVEDRVLPRCTMLRNEEPGFRPIVTPPTGSSARSVVVEAAIRSLTVSTRVVVGHSLVWCDGSALSGMAGQGDWLIERYATGTTGIRSTVAALGVTKPEGPKSGVVSVTGVTTVRGVRRSVRDRQRERVPMGDGVSKRRSVGLKCSRSSASAAPGRVSHRTGWNISSICSLFAQLTWAVMGGEMSRPRRNRIPVIETTLNVAR